MPQHAGTRSNTLQSVILRYVYYKMERVGANRSMLGHATRINLLTDEEDIYGEVMKVFGIVTKFRIRIVYTYAYVRFIH